MTARTLLDGQKQAWEQLLRLLSGRSWQFQAEHWAPLEKLVSWHHVTLDFHRELSAHKDRHEFRDDQLEALHQRVLAERKHLLILTHLQKQVHSQLETNGIRVLFFKGILAGQWLYGSNLARQCRDIDLIVHPNDHIRACKILYKLDCFQLIPRESISAFGMRRYHAAMKDFSLVHRPSGCVIELHWKLRPFNQAFQFDFDTAWEKRRYIEIDQQKIPAFDDSTHIRYLAAHGCNSHWGRLCWLIDWQKIAQRAPGWNLIIQDCAHAREQTHLKNAFALTLQQLGCAIPDAINALPKPRFSEFVIKTQSNNQMLGQYPNWPQRQLLNLACQQDLPGVMGYLKHMFKKALAADTLAP